MNFVNATRADAVTADLHYLAYSAVLTWVMLLTASALRARLWTPKGLMLGLGNRDQLPEPSPVAGRADRAAKNMLENLLLFAIVVLVARLGGVAPDEIAIGAAVFFWARVAYFFIYLAGIPFLRTAAWAVSIAGLVMILLTSH
jgi:uncharacterized MAPEG superfamily protein